MEQAFTQFDLALTVIANRGTSILRAYLIIDATIHTRPLNVEDTLEQSSGIYHSFVSRYRIYCCTIITPAATSLHASRACLDTMHILSITLQVFFLCSRMTTGQMGHLVLSSGPSLDKCWARKYRTASRDLENALQ